MNPQNKQQEFKTEMRAYGVESYVPKALGVAYPNWNLWNPAWKPEYAEANRFTGVMRGASASTADWCQQSGAPGC